MKTLGTFYFPVLASAPSSPTSGQVYFNSSDGKHYGYTGSGWFELAGITQIKLVTESTTSRTLAITDGYSWIRTTNAGAVSITVPPESSVAWAEGTEIVFEQAGAGQITLVPGSGVTINTSKTLKSDAQYAVIGIKKVGVNIWTCTGERAS